MSGYYEKLLGPLATAILFIGIPLLGVWEVARAAVIRYEVWAEVLVALAFAAYIFLPGLQDSWTFGRTSPALPLPVSRKVSKDFGWVGIAATALHFLLRKIHTSSGASYLEVVTTTALAIVCVAFFVSLSGVRLFVYRRHELKESNPDEWRIVRRNGAFRIGVGLVIFPLIAAFSVWNLAKHL